jgi:hypothetical protein
LEQACWQRAGRLGLRLALALSVTVLHPRQAAAWASAPLWRAVQAWLPVPSSVSRSAQALLPFAHRAAAESGSARAQQAEVAACVSVPGRQLEVVVVAAECVSVPGRQLEVAAAAECVSVPGRQLEVVVVAAECVSVPGRQLEVAAAAECVSVPGRQLEVAAAAAECVSVPGRQLEVVAAAAGCVSVPGRQLEVVVAAAECVSVEEPWVLPAVRAVLRAAWGQQPAAVAARPSVVAGASSSPSRLHLAPVPVPRVAARHSGRGQQRPQTASPSARLWQAAEVEVWSW